MKHVTSLHRRLVGFALLTLAGCAATVTPSADEEAVLELPALLGWFDGQPLRYVTTDVSDAGMAKAMGVNFVPRLAEALGLAYIFISHDLAVVRFMADEVMVMKDGEVVEQASAEQILDAPRQEYTRKLLGAIPRGYRAATPS